MRKLFMLDKLSNYSIAFYTIVKFTVTLFGEEGAGFFEPVLVLPHTFALITWSDSWG